jgi:hypothetical protein
MALADKDRVWAYRDLTITPTTVRTGLNGTTGDYVCNVVCSDSSDNKADLIGASTDRHWYLFAPAAFTTINTVTLHFQMSNVI